MAALIIDPDSVTAAGTRLTALADGASPPSPVTITPSAPDPVSTGVAATLRARAAGLSAYSAAGATIVGLRGAHLGGSATAYLQQEAANAASLSTIVAAGSSNASAPPPTPAPIALPTVPAVTPPTIGPPPANGRAIAELLHRGPGSGALTAAAQQLRSHAIQLRHVSQQLITNATHVTSAWPSDTGTLAGNRIGQLGTWFGQHAQHTDDAAAAMLDHAESFERTKAGVPTPAQFDAVERRLKQAAAANANPASLGRYARVVTALQAELSQMNAEAVTRYGTYSSDATAASVTGTPLTAPPQPGTNPHDPTIKAVDFKTGPPLPDVDERKRNQKDAFRQLFGRDPVSQSDWTTAANLDPHSYAPKFQGTPPEVRVVKIRPVPGQGVVRSSQFISDFDVTGFPPPSRDLGNNRGPNVHFDPEDTKVTMTIDYDNGVVVMRQNPSVLQNADGSTGISKVAVPTGTVTQTADGAVRIHYDSGNPFAPEFARDPNGIMAGHQVTVNGDLVFTPGANGVRIDGTRTDYPWMEVYQDMPNGTTHTVLIDPAAQGGALGPATNLPFHHDVGNGGKAFAPFDTGAWNPRYDVRVPLPATAFGPVAAPPEVPQLPGSGRQLW